MLIYFSSYFIGGEKMPRWKYKLVCVAVSGCNKCSLEKKLNVLGKEGWELEEFSCVSSPGAFRRITVVLKREERKLDTEKRRPFAPVGAGIPEY